MKKQDIIEGFLNYVDNSIEEKEVVKIINEQE